MNARSSAKLWLESEQVFSAGQYAALEEPRIVQESSAGILISAPHAVTHVRDGKKKRADRGTGGLAITLGMLTKAGYVVETSGTGDPAWDTSHPFKETVQALAPRLIIDVHGMKNNPHVDIDLGRGQFFGDVEDQLVHSFQRLGDERNIRVGIDTVFDASRESTVTSWAQAQGIRAFQVEICAGLRPPEASTLKLEAVIATFVDFVHACREAYR
jgi:hypothetical protein